jgi:hypothetical protein
MVLAEWPCNRIYSERAMPVVTAIHFNTGRIGAHAPEFVRYCIEFAPGNEKTISDSSHRTVINRRRAGRRPGQPEVRTGSTKQRRNPKPELANKAAILVRRYVEYRRNSAVTSVA